MGFNTILVNIMHVIMFFMIFLYSSFYSTHILNLYLFSANLVKNKNISYHVSLFSITYTMRLTPFDSFKVKWLNSHNFYKLYGCRDIGKQVGSMDMNDDKKEEETTFH